MKFILSSALVMAVFFAPLAAWGAYNDVTLTTDTVLSVGGATVNVSGSSAVVESIVVSASSFDVVLLPSSTITITASDQVELNTNTETYTTTDSCNSITLTGSDASATVTVTPDTTDTCSSGGGGGSRSTPKPVTPPVTMPPAPSGSSDLSSLIAQLKALIVQAQALGIAISPAVSALVGNTPAASVFSRDLTVGASGEDARALQVYLNAHNAVIADSGPGSKGNETTMFGALTKAALAKFQASVGISPASGYLGPKTRAYIEAHP